MDNILCRKYRGYIIRQFHGHYIIVGNDEEICAVDTIEEAKQEIDNMVEVADEQTN